MIYLSIRNFRKGFVGTGKVRKVMKYKIMEYDDVLKLYEADLDLRVNDYHKKREELIGANGSIVDFANGHEYFVHTEHQEKRFHTEHRKGGFTVSGHRALLRCIWQVSSMAGITENIQWSV